ncbi:hypothetical protein DPMN_095211 [Dreissena polymorpha]|uniref:Uncharacterized protein n=1 Tax=Dreissena polymorpha TaxID=45954 RepID=A0A9D4L7D4_DREPO|nr:hypothetical protein DPMN_095162 [Dreissena polymorpha]KAH3852698.1 hypothetical protein DPMN_095211 [Dreissena polymorpha]
MPVASRKSAGLPMYRSFTGSLPVFTGAPPGHHRRQPERCRSSAGVYMGPGAATVPSRLFPVASRLFPVPRRSLPVLHGDSRFTPQVLNICILTRWSPDCPRSSPVHPGRPRWSPVHPGRAPVHPGRSRITHRGSTGIIVRMGLKPVNPGLFNNMSMHTCYSNREGAGSRVSNVVLGHVPDHMITSIKYLPWTKSVYALRPA